MHIEEKNNVIKQELSDYEIHIDAYRTSLNEEGVWLFLATLGCWSVSPASIQLYALAITLILFSYRIYSKLSDKNKKKFSTITKELEIKINNELPEGDTQKARLHDLDQIKHKKLSTTNHVKSTLIFLLCYSFLGVTLLHWFQSNG